MTFNFKYYLVFLLMVGFSLLTHAQEEPPRPVKVTTFQNLSFGAFYHGYSGGTVIVYPNGSRSVTGDVIAVNLGFTFAPAIFEVEARPGAVINISLGPDVIISGSNGGSVTLHPGGTDPVSPFVNTIHPPGKTQVRVGGTLIVGSPLANPPGSYSGTFSVTFNQE